MGAGASASQVREHVEGLGNAYQPYGTTLEDNGVDGALVGHGLVDRTLLLRIIPQQREHGGGGGATLPYRTAHCTRQPYQEQRKIGYERIHASSSSSSPMAANISAAY